MNVTGISSANLYTPPQTDTRRQTFQTLVDAIQSGDLTTAQQAYTTLAQSLPPNSDGTLAQDFAAVGQALKTGDVSSAQQALSALQGDAQKLHGGHHRHHHHGGGATGGVDPTANSTNASTDPTLIPTPGSTINVKV